MSDQWSVICRRRRHKEGKMEKGRIIYLNGVTSSGKTSIVEALQARRDVFFYVVANDLFQEMVGEEYLKEDSVNYTVSFNGKARYNMEFPVDADNDTLQKEVIADERSEKWMEGKQIVKVIVVPKKLINIVLK